MTKVSLFLEFLVLANCIRPGKHYFGAFSDIFSSALRFLCLEQYFLADAFFQLFNFITNKLFFTRHKKLEIHYFEAIAIITLTKE